MGEHDELGAIDDLVVRLMGHASMAKAYKDAMRRDPGLTAGFAQLEERHREAVRTLSDEIRTAAAPLTAMRERPAALAVVTAAART